jgi:hypothetical protein
MKGLLCSPRQARAPAATLSSLLFPGSELVGGDEDGADVCGDVGHLRDRLFELRRELAGAVEQLLGSGVIAFGFDHQEVASEIGDGWFDLGEVHGEGAVRQDGEAALLQEIVELESHTASVGFVKAEAEGAEGGCEIGGV